MDSTVARRVLAVVLCVYTAFRFRRFAKWQRKMAAAMPGPPVSLWKGNLPQMIEAGGFTEGMFKTFHDQYGDVVRAGGQ